MGSESLVINEISLMDTREPQNHTGKGKWRSAHWRTDACTLKLNAARMLSYIKMHANRFALSLPLPGIHNQPKLLPPQNKEN